ncbi:MAG: helix-turn-helix transcriptional regulator [Treponema sp.]|nr:helix-turn-helix transcriptional regulator [Treponema sp.]
MNFSENLRFVMESRDIQVKELSAQTGISINTLKSYLKTDAVEPKVSNAVLIAKALHVNVESLALSPPGSEENMSAELREIHLLIKDFSPTDLRLLLALARAIRVNDCS